MASAWEFRADEDTSMTATLPPRDEIAAYHLFDEPRLMGGLVERAIYTDDERRRIGDLAGRLARAARANRAKHGGVDAFMHEYGLHSRGRHHPDVPRRGAAAHPRQGHRRRADRREDRRRPVGEAPRCVRQPVRQRLDLRADADRPRRQARRRQGRRSDQHAQAPGRPLRRAVHPPGAAPGHAHPGRQFRARPHHPGGPASRRSARGARLPVLLRHAGRARQDRRRRRRAISSATCRPSRRSARRLPRSGDVARAAGAARACPSSCRRCTRASIRARRSGSTASCCRGSSNWPQPRAARPRPHRRCRGAGPPRPHARPVRSAFLRSRARAAGRASASPCRPTASAPCRCCAGCGAWPSRASKRIPVRLVKGAYWDSEIKWAQERGPCRLSRSSRARSHTDVSYLACVQAAARRTSRRFFPQFATHNAHTMPRSASPAARRVFELQRLHGMGEALYDEIVGSGKLNAHCRIYAPVGAPRGPRRLSRASPAGERRQHLFRQPPGRRGGADRRRSSATPSQTRGSASATSRSARAPAPARDLLAGALEQPRPRADRADRARRVARRDARRAEGFLRSRPDRRRRDAQAAGGRARALPARPARAHRHGAHRRLRGTSRPPCECRRAPRALGHAGR